MLFNSQEFVFLFLATFILYYLPFFSRFQVHLLIVSSLIFYAYSEPILLILLLSSIGFNTIVSFAQRNLSRDKAKVWVTLGVIANLSVILFFKYSGMLANSFGFAGSEIGHFLVMLPLPLGISFFTFEGISLLVDVYKEPSENRHAVINGNFFTHLSNTLLFVSFFPHLIAGPILKASEFYPQIGGKEWRGINWEKAYCQLIVGYFLKVVIADNLKDNTFWIAYPYFIKLSSATLLTMLGGYSMQIFADFAGYSLIALGLATLLGYELKGNFNFPYIATSFSEFWRRWHISLSSFLREYLYFPLGGNRKGKVRTYFNLFITMFLGGLWHGAAWSYAIWGVAHGLFLAIERLANDYFPNRKQIVLLNWFVVFAGVSLAWLLFKLPEFSHAIIYVYHLFANWRLVPDYEQIKSISAILVYSFPVVAYHLQHMIESKQHVRVPKSVKHLLYAAMLLLIVINAGSKSEFIYFQF